MLSEYLFCWIFSLNEKHSMTLSDAKYEYLRIEQTDSANWNKTQYSSAN